VTSAAGALTAGLQPLLPLLLLLMSSQVLELPACPTAALMLGWAAQVAMPAGLGCSVIPIQLLLLLWQLLLLLRTGRMLLRPGGWLTPLLWVLVAGLRTQQLLQLLLGPAALRGRVAGMQTQWSLTGLARLGG
jgi:hypothetical protein